jgi:hypothetical protein
MAVEQHTDSDLAVLEAKVDDLGNQMAILNNKVQALSNTLTTYKGFLGGALFVVTAVWAFLSLVWKQLIDGKAGH